MSLANARYLKRFTEKGTTHGSVYLANPRLSFVERVLWLLLTLLALYLSIYFSMQSLYRFNTRSTVVTIDIDYRNWNTTFPSITICPMQRVSFQKLRAFLVRTNNCKQNCTRDLYLFLQSLANSTYLNFDTIKEFPIEETIGLHPADYMSFIYNITEHHELELTGDVEEVLTEWGLCYTKNNAFNDRLSSVSQLFGDPYKLANDLRPTIAKNYFDVNKILEFKGAPYSYKIFIHGANEVMAFEKYGPTYTNDVHCNVKMLEVTASEEFERSTRVEQRQCRFPHESNLKYFPNYTKNLCQQECRINLAYQLCKCIPHFYPGVGGLMRVCHYKELKNCIFEYADVFQNLHKMESLAAMNISVPKCECLPNCSSLEVVESSCEDDYSPEWQRYSNVNVTMDNLPRLRYQRQIVFSFTDLLVSIGGSVGLFLGASVLSLVEVVYYFTLRLICHCDGYKE